MTIRIEILDPHLIEKDAMIKTCKYLMGMVNMGMEAIPFKPRGAISEPPAPIPPCPQDSVSQTTIPAPWKDLPVGQVLNLQTGKWEDAKPLVVTNNVPEPLSSSSPTTIEQDAAGLPWDNRIHSRTKSKTSDGKWRYKREINDHIIQKVEGELRQALAAPIIEETIEIVKPVEMPTVAANTYVPPPPVKPLVDLMPPIISTPPAPPAGTPAPSMDFPALMQKITAALQSGKITSQTVISIVHKFGLPNLPVVGTRPDLVPAIAAEIDKLIGA